MHSHSCSSFTVRVGLYLQIFLVFLPFCDVRTYEAWSEKMCRTKLSYESFKKLSYFRIFFGLVIAKAGVLFAVVHLPPDGLGELFFWQFRQPNPSSSWSSPETMRGQPTLTSLSEEKKVRSDNIQPIGRPEDHLDTFQHAIWTPGLRRRCGLGFDPGKKPALGPNPQSFRLENLLGRSKRLLGALAVLLPDFLNGGGDNNHNFGSPFCHFFCLEQLWWKNLLGCMIYSIIVPRHTIQQWFYFNPTFVAFDQRLLYNSDRRGSA